jgi:transposase
VTPVMAMPSRFIGLDVHKHYVVVGAVDTQQTVVLRPRRLSLEEFERWRRTQLHASDAIVLEATGSAWHIYDQLLQQTPAVSVANPLLIRWIGSAPVKTDGHDTLKLARLLAAGLVPLVWVPPSAVRDLRALVAHRRRLIAQRTQTRNRLHALLQRHNLMPPDKDPFAPPQRGWWQALSLELAEQLLLSQDLQILDALTPLIAQAEAALYLQSVREPWAAQVPYLIQQTGIGLLTAMILLAAIGDISRFPHPSKLVGYAGLGAAVHVSGQTHTQGGITKQGRRELRAAMLEAAWVAVEHNPHWKGKFSRYAKRLGRQKAIVAIARQMLVSVWYLWHNRMLDRHTDALAIARKLMTWAEHGGKAMRQGLTCVAFVRARLDQLDIGHELTSLRYGSHVYPLPPSATPLTNSHGA